jgi:hypothetical protein
LDNREILMFLEIIRLKMPALYRHLIGLIKQIKEGL